MTSPRCLRWLRISRSRRSRPSIRRGRHHFRGRSGLRHPRGTRCLRTISTFADVAPVAQRLANSLFENIPPAWARKAASPAPTSPTACARRRALGRPDGYGARSDSEFVEEHGCMAAADPACVSDLAKKRQPARWAPRLGKHYLEVQVVEASTTSTPPGPSGYPPGRFVRLDSLRLARAGPSDRTGLSRQPGEGAPRGWNFASDRELACAPIRSPGTAQQSHQTPMRARSVAELISRRYSATVSRAQV